MVKESEFFSRPEGDPARTLPRGRPPPVWGAKQQKGSKKSFLPLGEREGTEGIPPPRGDERPRKEARQWQGNTLPIRGGETWNWGSYFGGHTVIVLQVDGLTHAGLEVEWLVEICFKQKYVT